jgi:ATP-dependent RNA helicase DeaD
MTTKLFSELGLSAELLKAIDKLGFEQAAPIQAEAIPWLMQGRDVVGQSETGSGKTVAFAVPVIEKVDPQRREVQALILCPTRELAVQVAEEFHKLALFRRGIHALPVYGGQSYERQFLGLRQGAQIVIGTPGRVMDHMRRGTLRLDAVRMVVLDEADEMLDMGFREDIEFVLRAVPESRQTVFFSATIPAAIQELIRTYARDPQYVRMEQKAMTVPTVEQVYYEVGWGFKVELLTRLIDLHDLKLGIIFCNTKRMVDDLVDHLNTRGYSADRLHGDMSQAMRDRVMHKFRKSGLEFLVATDVAARGIDVEDVQVVFNYDLPYDPEDYVHRIGRTGRAGRSGLAVSFVAGRELFQVQHIERFARTRIRRGRIPTLGDVEEARTSQWLARLRTTLQAGAFKRQDHLIERLLEEGFTSTDVISALLHHLQGGEAVAPTPSNRSSRSPAPPSTRAQPAKSKPPGEPPQAGPIEGPRPEPVWPARGSTARQASLRRPSSQTASGAASGLTTNSALAPAGTSAKPVAPPPQRPASSMDEPGSRSPRTEAAPEAEMRTAADEFRKRASQPGPAPDSTRPDARAKRGAKVKTVADDSRAPARPAVPEPPSLATSARPGDAPSATSPAPSPTGVPSAPDPVPGPVSRRTPSDQTRLYMNSGTEMGLSREDVVQAIMGETGLPETVVGRVDLRERHVFFDVAAEFANAILSKLKRAQIKGRKVKVKVA